MQSTKLKALIPGMTPASVMASAVLEGPDEDGGSQGFQVSQYTDRNDKLPLQGPAYDRRVARLYGTKDDDRLISVATFEARVGSTPAVLCARTPPRCYDHAADSSDPDECAGLQAGALRFPQLQSQCGIISREVSRSLLFVATSSR